MSTNGFVNNILKRIGQPHLIDLLAHKVSGTELNSILLEVFRERCQTMTPGTLMRSYHQNKFVKPGDLPALQLKQIELDLSHLFNESCFESLELSPVSVLGSCSVVGLASQHKILSALRGTEVMADATNALALHIAEQKQQGFWKPESSSDMMKFSVIQRHLRTQSISAKGFTPHFKIACLVSAGTDTGSYAFEKKSLMDHISLIKNLFLSYYKVQRISFRFICRPEGYKDAVAMTAAVNEFITNELPGTEVQIIYASEKSNAYYKGLQYKIDIEHNNRTYEIGDGGFVDWTQQLLQNKKERMLSTGIGFEFLYRILKNQV